MTIHQDNMESVQDWGESVPPDIWYHVRVSKIEERTSDNSGEPMVLLQFKIQDEPYVGRVITDNASLQAHALFKLKALYGATEYFPGASGHDPDQLLGRELYVKPSSKMYQGQPRLEIKPHNIKSIRDGRPQNTKAS